METLNIGQCKQLEIGTAAETGEAVEIEQLKKRIQ
jgi:hypothetical protein